MSCCCTSDKRIIIIKKNDTDFNNGNLVEFNITSDIYNITDFTAELILGDIKREFNDLSSGVINFNLSKEETGTLPYGNIDGVMNLIDSKGRVATISSIIPFRVVGIVENDAIKTSDVDYTINVEQGGKNIFNIDVKTNVSVIVGTVETLPSGSSAYVENVGTPTGVVLNFGIPQGIQGEQGIRGEQGIQGEKGDTGSKGEKGDKGDTGATGEAATIQVGTVTTLNPSEPAYVQNVGTEQNAIFNFGIPKGDSGSGANADFSDITGSPYDCDALAAALNEKQNVIEDLPDIRSGAELGSTAVQPSSLATVATSGSYNDLSNKPTIPPAQINSDWDASSGVSQILNKPNLATVATSGSYADLSNKPTIPDEQIQSDWTQSDNTKVDYIKNKPTLATVATSGSYTDLSNKPSIPQALSDIAVAGDNIRFNLEGLNIDAQDMSPSAEITEKGLFYPSSENSSATIILASSVPNYTGSIFTGSYDWSWTVRFKLKDTFQTRPYNRFFTLTSSSGSGASLLVQYENGAFHLGLGALGGVSNPFWTWSSNEPAISLDYSKVYNLKFSRDTSNQVYRLELSEDLESWTTVASISSSYNLSRTDLIYLALKGYDTDTGDWGIEYFDMGGVSFSTNYPGVDTWTAFVPTGKYYINATVPSVDQTYNASSANPQSGVAINGAGFLKNTATDSNSLSILGNASGYFQSVNIGANSKATHYSTVLGYNARTEYTYGVAIGYNAFSAGNAVCIGYPTVSINGRKGATNTNTIAIGQSTAGGSNAIAIGVATTYGDESIAIGRATTGSGANYAIQLGCGSNNTSNTFSVGLSSSLNVRLLNSDGTIPYERLPIATSVDSTSTNSQVVGAKLFYDTCGNITALINAL